MHGPKPGQQVNSRAAVLSRFHQFFWNPEAKSKEFFFPLENTIIIIQGMFGVFFNFVSLQFLLLLFPAYSKCSKKRRQEGTI